MNHARASDVLDVVSCMDVAEYLGLRMENRGGKMVLECPFHEEELGRKDAHIGNCVISPNGRTCKCYACGRHGSAINMVMSQLGIGFCQATDLLAAEFAPSLLSFDNNAFSGKYKIKKSPFTKEDMELIGLKCEGTWIGKDVFSSKKEALENGYQKVEYDGEGNVIGMEWDRYSILDLYSEDEECFAEIVLEKAREKLSYFERYLKSVQSLNPSEFREITTEWVEDQIWRIKDIIYETEEMIPLKKEPA